MQRDIELSGNGRGSGFLKGKVGMAEFDRSELMPWRSIHGIEVADLVIALCIGCGRAQRVPAGGDLNARDGAAIKDEAEITITARDDAELVMVDSL